MTDREKLFEAARLLQDYCKIEMGGGCFTKRCPLCDGEECMLGGPNSWHIPKPRRWTDEDVALAKSLKVFGVTKISAVNHRGKKTVWVVDGISNCYLPDAAFASMKPGECVSIDDIIAEGEQA